jgi:hypothetical protein
LDSRMRRFWSAATAAGLFLFCFSMAVAQTATPPRVSGIAGAGSVDVGQRVVLAPIFTSGTALPPFQFQWRKDGLDLPGATSELFIIDAATSSHAGTYAVVVTNSAGSATATGELTLRPPGPIVFTTPPRSATIQFGQSVGFSFVATGSFPRTYQWLKDGQPVAGATLATLGISAATTADAGGYAVTVTNSFGAVTSASAALSVNAATSLRLDSSTPAGNTVTQGTSTSLSVRITEGSSPFTFQWLRNGTPIAGATNVELRFAAVALTEAGSYTVVVTNPISTVTSVAATLIVTPATPITFIEHPLPVTAHVGESASFFAPVRGSDPITYQWLRNDVPIPGANQSALNIFTLTPNDAGNYAVTVTNAAGSVTSRGAALIVLPAVAPTITRQPTSQTVGYSGTVTFSVEVSGSGPLTYMWKKDGVDNGFRGQSMELRGVTPAQAGAYTVTVTNPAGSVTSQPATLTVLDANAPRITKQPVSIEVPLGLPATVWVEVESTTGFSTLSIQWRKNGVNIPGATSATFTINAVQPSDTGEYSAVATNPGGSVTSQSAKITVLPPAPPLARTNLPPWLFETSGTVGGYAGGGFAVSDLTGSAPMNFQWFKEGAAIPGATSFSINFPTIAATDFGTYTLRITNDGGVFMSPPFRLRVDTGTTPWREAVRFGDLVYFLYTTPAQIARYDLAAERWLPAVALTPGRTPTRFAPAVEGVYLAYDRTLVRRSPDLTTETSILTASSSIEHLFVFGDALYYALASGNGYSRLHRTTLQDLGFAGRSVDRSYYYQTSVAAGIRKAFSRTGSSSAGMDMLTFAADGTFTAQAGPDRSRFPSASRTFVFPGEQYVADDAGVVYRTSDLGAAGSLGEPVGDLDFFADGTPVVLRDRTVTTARRDAFFEDGRHLLTRVGLRLFARNDAAYVFGPPETTGGTPSVVKLARSEIAPSTPAALPGAAGQRFSIDDAYFGDGVVHVFSRSQQALVRWSPGSRSFLPSVPLRAAPRMTEYQPGNNRALFLYPDGHVTEVPLSPGATSERVIGTVSNLVSNLLDLGDLALVSMPFGQSTDGFSMLFGTGTNLRATRASVGAGSGSAWVPATRRIYSPVSSSAATTEYQVVDRNGLPGARGVNSNLRSVPPLRFNPEGTFFVTGNGRVVSGELVSVGALSNDISDAAWLPGGLYTLRTVAGETQVQRWSRGNYLQTGTLSIRGLPVRIFQISDTQLVVISQSLGFPIFTLVNSDLSVEGGATVTQLAGSYFGTLSGVNGTFALQVRADRTGVMLVHIAGTSSGVAATSFTVNTDGTFVANGADLKDGSTRSIVGTLGADGLVTGAIASLNASFSGARASAGAMTAGYYQTPAVNGATGVAHTIVAADGSTFVLAQSGAAIDGGTGRADSAGRFAVAAASGTALNGSIDAVSGRVALNAENGLAGTTFIGLRDDVPRTDRLANISTRGRVGIGEDVMIAGFVVTGTAARPVLVRAIGPALAGFGLSGVLADPRLRLFRGNTVVAENDNWGVDPAAGGIAAASTRVGAFALSTDSRDAVLLATLDPGSYTAQVSAATGAGGVALVEVYDAGESVGVSEPRLINIATRGRVGAAEDTLIAGIVVTGNAPKRVLIRAIGPTLASFGVGGALSDPTLTLLSGTTTLRTNDDWSAAGGSATAAEIGSAAAAVGAFGLSFSARDACLLLTLAPGSYTAQVSGKAGATGIALVEVYEVSN